MADGPAEVQLIATNRKARFEYEIFDRFQAGIALLGPEVKSLRAGKANLADAYAIVRRGEVFLVGAYIAPFERAARENAETRPRSSATRQPRIAFTLLTGKSFGKLIARP